MSVQGSLLRDVERDPVGRVVDVLLDPDTREPRWLRVDAGEDVLVPAAAASEITTGELIVPYDAATIRAARHDGATVSEADAGRLSTLYGFA